MPARRSEGSGFKHRLPHKVDSALYFLDGGIEMSSSLTAKVTLGSAERPGHLPAMYGKCHIKTDGPTPEISTGPTLEAEYHITFLPTKEFNRWYSWTIALMCIRCLLLLDLL